uniref:Uncharacterized protein n=1 Tax=Panagrolaimus sp. ES5 TaxID=591445 RepID=A0AC34GUX1_9BILA
MDSSKTEKNSSPMDDGTERNGNETPSPAANVQRSESATNIDSFEVVEKIEINQADEGNTVSEQENVRSDEVDQYGRIPLNPLNDQQTPTFDEAHYDFGNSGHRIIEDYHSSGENIFTPPTPPPPETSNYDRHGNSGSRIIEDYHSSGENIYTPPTPPQSNNQQQQNDTPLTSRNERTGNGSNNNTAPTSRTLDELFENFLQMLLETNLEQLDSYEVRSFALKTPKNYRPLKTHYSLIFEVLFKMKEVNNRAVVNDTLAFIGKVFEGVDFNQFLLQFWAELKRRDLNPIGFSFTNGQPRFDYDGVNSDHNSPQFLSVKTVEFAWSLFVDLDATMKFILDKCVYSQSLIVFHFCILRRLSCLGEFMVDGGRGTQIPIFLHYIRSLINDPEVQDNRRLYEISLSLMVSVAWSHRGPHCWSLMSPNFVLSEIIQNLLEHNNATFPCWVKALQEIFHPLESFTSVITWKDGGDTDGYDNPGKFLIAFVECYHRNNTLEINNMLRDVLEIFKKQMLFCRVRYEISKFDEIHRFDWLSAYFVVEFLGISNFEHQIPKSLYKLLPPNCLEKYSPLPDTVETLDQALIHIFELYFLVGPQISEDLYKDVWKTYPSPPSSIEAVAQAIIAALNNLKNAFKISIDRHFTRMVQKLCSCMDNKFLDSMCSFAEMNAYFVFGCHHIFVIGRVVRRMMEAGLNGRRRVTFTDLDHSVHEMFLNFVEVVTDKFNEFRDANFDTWPPWRSEREKIMPDDKLMAIVYTLDLIQKDAFCIYDMLLGNDKGVIDFLFFLQKKRKILGINYTKVSSLVNKIFPPPVNNEENEGQMRNANRDGRENYNDQSRRNNYGQDSGNSDYRSVPASTSQPHDRFDSYSTGRNPPPSSTYQDPHHGNRERNNY